MSKPRSHSTCPVCEGRLARVAEVRDFAVGRRAVRVPDRFSRCTACGEEFYAPGQLEATQRRASGVVRSEEGLLLPEEIRAIRESLGLTQSGFERLLGVGAKTVVRWERGTVFQNQATDALLRVIQAFPAAASFLAERHGVALPGDGSPELPRARGASPPAPPLESLSDTGSPW